MSIIDEIKSMSPEERAALAAELNKLQQKQEPKVEAVSLGEPMHGADWDSIHNRPLTAEEIYDRDHPLAPMLWPYGYTQTKHVFGRDPFTRHFSREQVDEHNRPIIEAWISEKRKHFPDCEVPQLPNIPKGSRFDDPRYTHPGMI